MKAILNWRYYAIAILFATGLLSAGRLFGEPTQTMSGTEWLVQAFISLTIAAVSFFVLYICIAYWEHRGQIPEFTRLKIDG